MKFIKRMLSEQGEPSSKRCAGFLVIIVVLCCTVGMVIEHYETVKELLEVEFISACSLIGLQSVTRIFDKSAPEE